MTPPHPPGRDLPPEIQSVLHAISRDMRNVPRENCATLMDVLLYIRRQAARVDGVCKMRVADGPKVARPAGARRPSPRDRAEAVFGGRPARETITCRQGRVVQVERRARQLEMML